MQLQTDLTGGNLSCCPLSILCSEKPEEQIQGHDLKIQRVLSLDLLVHHCN